MECLRLLSAVDLIVCAATIRPKMLIMIRMAICPMYGPKACDSLINAVSACNTHRARRQILQANVAANSPMVLGELPGYQPSRSQPARFRVGAESQSPTGLLRAYHPLKNIVGLFMRPSVLADEASALQ